MQSRRNRWLAGVAVRVGALGVAGILAGCADAADVDATADATPTFDADSREAPIGPAANAGDMPSLYLDRKVERINDGSNRMRDGYREALENCREAGTETSPLGPDDEALVGTERWQLWRGADFVTWRREAWEVESGDLDAGTMCRFTLKPKGEHVRVQRDQTVVLDLDTGERSVDEGDPSLFDVTPADAPGDGGDGGEAPTTRSVAGQPCAEWRGADGSTSCFWSGGLAWGYGAGSRGAFSSLNGIVPLELVLQASPAPGKVGDRLETTRFIVGGRLPPGDTVPPSSKDAP